MRITLYVMTVLLVVLAAYQFHMLGEVSRAQRVSMAQTMDRAAQELADDLDTHITGLVLDLFRDIEARSPGDPESWLGLFSENAGHIWAAKSVSADLLEGIYLTDPHDRGLVHLPRGGDRFEPTTRPAFIPDHGQPRDGRRGRRRRTRLDLGLQADPLRISLPLPGRGRPRRFAEPQMVILIDETRLREDLLPDLVERHCSRDFSVVVQAVGTERPLVYNRYPDGAPPPRSREAQPLLRLRPTPAVVSRLQTRLSLDDGEAELMKARLSRFFQGMLGEPLDRQEALWRVTIGHRSGSLDDVLGHAHARNLALSAGILLVLAGAIILLARSTRRLRALARRQLEFVAGVSHELMTPLTGIRTAAQNLSEGVVSAPDRVKQYGALIQGETTRLTNMVEQVLAYAGIQSGTDAYRLAPVPLGTLLAETLARIEGEVEAAGMTLETRIAEELPMVTVDRDAFDRVLSNLIGNAVKYASEGGWIGIEAARETNLARITVSDRGPGIDRDDLDHVFEPFYRGKRHVASTVHGSGLGLCLARHIVDAMGGRITARNTSPGVALTITLPIHEEPS